VILDGEALVRDTVTMAALFKRGSVSSEEQRREAAGLLLKFRRSQYSIIRTDGIKQPALTNGGDLHRARRRRNSAILAYNRLALSGRISAVRRLK